MKRLLLTALLFLLLGAIVNVAVIVLVVFVARDVKPSVTESVTFYADGQGVVRAAASPTHQARPVPEVRVRPAQLTERFLCLPRVRRAPGGEARAPV